MSKKRILFITHEMAPFVDTADLGGIMAKLPKYIQDKGNEIRVLMPRFGVVNERKHKLHEVVRLSGMNIIVDDDDYPLIIKVASYPGARMQVYFLDNEEFFKRKFVFLDKDEKPFEDNQDRMVFFNKGALEIVRKLGWAPDVILVSGWMSSLVPFFVKTVYKDDPIFTNAKVVYAFDNPSLGNTFTDDFFVKASINELNEEDLSSFKDDSGNISLHQGAIMHSDALIMVNDPTDDALKSSIDQLDIPKHLHNGEEDFLPGYLEFFNSLIEEIEEDEE